MACTPPTCPSDAATSAAALVRDNEKTAYLREGVSRSVRNQFTSWVEGGKEIIIVRHLIWILLALFWLGMQAAAGLPPPGRIAKDDLSSMDAIRSIFRHTASVSVQPRTHLAISADFQSREQLCRTVFSALVNGYDAPHLINFNKTLPNSRSSTIAKYDGYLRERGLQKDDLVLLVDKTEAWFQIPEVVARHRMMQSGSSLIVGTQSSRHASPTSSKAHDSRHWLDAGAFFGKEKSISYMMQEASKSKQKGTDDVEVLSTLLKEQRQAIDFSVDVSFGFYQSMSLMEANDVSWSVAQDRAVSFSLFSFQDAQLDEYDTDLVELGLMGGNHFNFWYKRPLARSNISNRIPVLLYSAGRPKDHKQWWQSMWFTQKGTWEELWQTVNKDTERGEAGAWDGKEWKSFRALCGQETLL